MANDIIGTGDNTIVLNIDDEHEEQPLTWWDCHEEQDDEHDGSDNDEFHRSLKALDTTPPEDDHDDDDSLLYYEDGYEGGSSIETPGEFLLERIEEEGASEEESSSIPMMASSSSGATTTDQMIADELKKLTITEREKVYEDVHGVSPQIKEDPKWIEELLKEVSNQLKVIPTTGGDKLAYELAFQQSPTFVTNRKFVIKFLRKSNYDSKAAADNIIQYFNYKLELFVGTKLTSRISFTEEDLSQESLEAIQRGSVQVLPNRDTQGRAVLLSFPAHHIRTSCSNNNNKNTDGTDATNPIPILMRGFWYILESLLDDEETQKKGVVFVSYGFNLQSSQIHSIRRQLMWTAGYITQALPIKFVGCHYCYESSLIMGKILPILAYTVGKIVRVRFRIHCGTWKESLCHLLSFGIPIEDIPLDDKGNLLYTNLKKWMERRKQKEKYLKYHHHYNDKDTVVTTIDLPSKKDILLGRGSKFYLHPGNRLLHEIVGKYYEEYNTLNRQGKTRLAKEIVTLVHNYSGHFIKLDDKSGMWMEVSDLEAREKVSHSFRRKKECEVKATTGREKGTPSEPGTSYAAGDIVETVQGTSSFLPGIKCIGDQNDDGDRSRKRFRATLPS